MKRIIRGTIGPVLIALAPLGPTPVQAQRVVTGGSFTPAANVLFLTDFSQDLVGSFPSGLKFVRGPLDGVLVDGVPMLRVIGEAEFQIPLGQPLPQDFTLEFDLIPKAGNGDDLTIEGGPMASRSVGSAEIRFNHQIASIMGGGQGMSQVTLPDDLRTELINQRSTVQMAMTGTQFKLFVNGRQIYVVTWDGKITGPGRTVSWTWDPIPAAPIYEIYIAFVVPGGGGAPVPPYSETLLTSQPLVIPSSGSAPFPSVLAPLQSRGYRTGPPFLMGVPSGMLVQFCVGMLRVLADPTGMGAACDVSVVPQ